MSDIQTSNAEWLNEPDKWRENIEAPVDSKWFQQELNLIGGMTLDGKPHYRIVWGMDMENAVMRDRYNDRFVPRYLYRTIRGMKMMPPENGGTIFRPVKTELLIGTPRLYIESFIPPEVACSSGSEMSYDAEGDKISAYLPTDGDWWPMFELCEHDEFGICCQYAFAEDRNCHGKFMVPNRKHLDSVRQLFQQMERERQYRPDEPVPKEVANSAFRYAIEREKKRREAIDAELSYNGANFMAAHGFTGSAKYHAMPGIEVKGVTQGWSVPDEE